MTTVQRTNKYLNSQFGKLSIGQLFSLGTNGTTLVKVSNTTWGIYSAVNITGQTASIPVETGPVFYFPPAVTASSGTAVFAPGPNPYVSGGSSITPDSSVIEQDPPFFKNLSSYLLSAVTTPVSGSDFLVNIALTWTFPNLQLVALSEFQHVTIDQVIIQRSTTTRAAPFSPTGDGPVNANVNSVAYSLLPSDPDWTTLLDLRPDYTIVGSDPSVYPIATTLSDSPPSTDSSHVFHYRVVCCLHVSTGTKYVLSWNVVTVVTPYIFTATNNGGPTNALNWAVPSTSELASLSRLFLNSFAVTRPVVSATPYTTTSAFTMPNRGSTVSLTVGGSSWASTNMYFTIPGAGVFQVSSVTNSTHLVAVNTGTNGNAEPAASIGSSTAVPIRWTELRWGFDLSTLPTDYTLQKSYDGTSYSTVISSLSNSVSQPFRDADPPNPTVYYKLIANMPDSEGISFPYVLTYTARSIS